MLKKTNLSVALLVCMQLLVTGCSGKSTHQPTESVINVKAVTIGKSEQNTAREFIGIVEEETATLLSFPVQGTLESLSAREGQFVQKGTLLATLNTSSLESMYAAARATLEQAEDALSRLQTLYDNESLPEIKYIEVKTDVEKARSMEQIARKNLDDSKLLAPYSGIIGRRHAEAGENVLPHQHIYTLLDIQQIKIKIAVPENEIANLQTGNQAIFSTGALPGKTFDGKITEKGIIADPVAHTYEVRISSPNPGNQLLPGMVCRVLIPEEHTNPTLMLPLTSIQKTADGQQFIWSITNGQAIRRNITTGAISGNNVIIENGLNEGDLVITGGYQKLSEGTKVNVL